MDFNALALFFLPAGKYGDPGAELTARMDAARWYMDRTTELIQALNRLALALERSAGADERTATATEAAVVSKTLATPTA